MVTPELDQEVYQRLQAATDYCENVTGRSFRLTTSRLEVLPRWCSVYRPYVQPVKAITSVQYYDTDGTQQTVDPGDYLLIPGVVNQIQFVSGFTFPTLDARLDAVEITYDAGYADYQSIDKRAIDAILLQLSVDWGDLKPQEMTAYQNSVENKLASLKWGYQ